MKIYFARHGRTNYNDLDLCNADPAIDVHITDTGKEQAQTLSNSLNKTPIDHIFVSELRRTRQTAEIVNSDHNVTIEVSPLLNDHRSGFEGKPSRLLMDALDTAEDRWTARFSSGESIDDVADRVSEFLGELKTKSYDNVLVITSGWVIYAAAAIIKRISYEEAWKLDISQGSYLEFDTQLQDLDHYTK